MAVVHVGSRRGADDVVEAGAYGLVHLFADEAPDPGFAARLLAAQGVRDPDAVRHREHDRRRQRRRLDCRRSTRPLHLGPGEDVARKPLPDASRREDGISRLHSRWRSSSLRPACRFSPAPTRRTPARRTASACIERSSSSFKPGCRRPARSRPRPRCRRASMACGTAAASRPACAPTSCSSPAIRRRTSPRRATSSRSGKEAPSQPGPRRRPRRQRPPSRRPTARSASSTAVKSRRRSVQAGRPRPTR